MRWQVIGILWLGITIPAWASAVDANPMNYDPQVRAAYKDFYNLNYSGAVDLFGRFHAEHPGDPQATAYLLNARIFQELYLKDLLDTTFYATDGFLTGRHAVEEDPKETRPDLCTGR